MGPGLSPQRVQAIARELLDAHDRAVLIESIAARDPAFDLDAAYQVAAELMRLRRGRGARPVGRKIGFTNRSIWARYKVDAPMWAHVYEDTVSYANGGKAVVSLAGTVSPRIEPEILFKLRAPVPAGCVDAQELLRAVAWYAHSVEIVHSHFDWNFRLPDATADWACHARLVIGAPQAIRAQDIPALARALPQARAALLKDGVRQIEGAAASVLDSPAYALGFLADLLARQPFMQPLAAGELISTGTITDALPVRPGESWSTEISGLPLQNLNIAFST
jgi:2-oxo-3-hexenedioate decarboxylase